ncbi:hypothetical protein C8A01DRAFT_35904 [Parachaetomium inaequale]|uniref:AB hydrolase-1 domain-containing protein n=1 Tax=Parachaetomium inaequale TaxID=2588326 RepID=A0AAN6PHI6_9PEZI|nr:hypothetical protein C8A01DRAFT_35904 [Parachaetomium inaequale]
MDDSTAHSPGSSQAISFLADIRFHRVLWLPPSPENGRPSSLRVTYSDLGAQDGEVLLVCGGLYGSRYTLAQADKLAKKRGVRLITPDKPGVGGTEPVDINQKVKAWFDIVQALVKRLDLKHVAFLGHSSGAIYILNSLLHLRHLMHQTRPYAALFTPWVLPSHSEAATPAIASMLPNWAIHKWYETSHFLSRNDITPNLGPSTARPGVKMDTDGMTKAIDEKIMEYALLEDVEGVCQEALFCLKRGGESAWGSWRDYDEYIPLLKQQESGRGGASKIELDVFLAETDNSSGERGSQWFDGLWKGEAGDWIRYSSSTVPGTTHETIMRMESGALGSVFERITTA